MNDIAPPKHTKDLASDSELNAMPQVTFIRYCIERLGFFTDSGDFDMVRAARFFVIRQDLFYALAAGTAPLLKRERDKMKNMMKNPNGGGVTTKKDAQAEAVLQNKRVGRYLRSLRERLFLVGIEGISKSQAQIAALLDVSVGAIQAWEYGSTRIPDIRMSQYLQVVGADIDQARKAWVMLGAMPEEIQEGLDAQDEQVMELWSKLVERCMKLKMPETIEVTPEKPVFDSHRQEMAHLKAAGATTEQLKEAALAPKPRKE